MRKVSQMKTTPSVLSTMIAYGLLGSIVEMVLMLFDAENWYVLAGVVIGVGLKQYVDTVNREAPPKEYFIFAWHGIDQHDEWVITVAESVYESEELAAKAYGGKVKSMGDTVYVVSTRKPHALILETNKVGDINYGYPN